MKKIKLAIGQIKIENGNTKENLNKIIAYMRRASNEECDLIVFPELAYTGYLLNKEELQNLAEGQEGYFVKTIKEKSRDLKISTLVGYVEKDSLIEGVIYNSCIFVDKEGKILENARKVNLWKREKSKFKAGHEFPVVNTEFGKIGILICYDMEFPEPPRLEALKGADLVLVPSLWSKFGENRWHIYLSANSLFNLYFMVGANTIDDNCCGKSKIVSPMGKPLIEGPGQEEALLIQEIDLDELIVARNKIPYFTDLDASVYSKDFLKR